MILAAPVDKCRSVSTSSCFKDTNLTRTCVYFETKLNKYTIYEKKSSSFLNVAVCSVSVAV